MILVDHDSYWEKGGCNYTEYLSALGLQERCMASYACTGPKRCK